MRGSWVFKMKAGADGWQGVAAGMRVFTLSMSMRLLIPSLMVAAMPRNAIGFSFEGGRSGAALGATLCLGSFIGALILYPVAGPLGALLLLWLLGTAGAAMLINSARPMAFVKPLCGSCRLLPVIREHEAIHISGVESDKAVWQAMRSRHSCASLSLNGDPTICWFCPIPKRLKDEN